MNLTKSRLPIGTLVVILTVLLTASATAEAQRGRGNPLRRRAVPHQQPPQFTDEQVQQMREIREAGGSREEMQAILTPEQQAKADAMHERFQEHRAERFERMRESLDLTDDQQFFELGHRALSLARSSTPLASRQMATPRMDAKSSWARTLVASSSSDTTTRTALR